MEALLVATQSQGRFQQYAQSLKPRNGPPAELVAGITDTARRIFSDRARLTRAGSTKKHTDIIGSDFDYHLVTPGRDVGRHDMESLERTLCRSGNDAKMGPTALKVRFLDADRMEGSLDIVPRSGTYLDDGGVVVEPASPAFYNDIRRQNAARALKYYVKHLLNVHVRSYELEMAVLAEDSLPFVVVNGQRLPRNADPHGLYLFKDTCARIGHGIPIARGQPPTIDHDIPIAQEPTSTTGDGMGVWVLVVFGALLLVKAVTSLAAPSP